LLALILTIAFLFRAMKRLGQVAAGLPPALTMGQTHMLTDGGPGFMGGGGEMPGHRLLAALDKLEKRIQEMEGKNPVSHQGSNGNAQGKHHHQDAETGERFDETESAAGVERAEQIALLLGKGQALMHMDKVESAVECFDEVIALEPKNSEALVKKGTALEKLKRLEDAIKCYDQAIAANNSMTLAYLYKGGVFNQMEKFSEALECYEQALRSQQKPVMSS
jgi:tetratricopeptide (TPR) repeat protein